MTDECIMKVWCIYTIEYYVAARNNDIMPFASTWLELEDLILSEVSQRKINTGQVHFSVVCRGTG